MSTLSKTNHQSLPTYKVSFVIVNQRFTLGKVQIKNDCKTYYPGGDYNPLDYN